jgi:SAM-dependent methyltransferase
LTSIRGLWNRFLSAAGLRGGLSAKQLGELLFWRLELQRMIDWYQGKTADLRGVAVPTEGARVVGYDLKENAMRTWLKALIRRYPSSLLVAEDYFAGKRILDIGCGPIPFATAFTDCEIYGLDQLADHYRRLGYPLDSYSDRFTYVKASAESIPFEDGFFDAVISVNALDHVDDFPRSAREMSRVLRPGGVLRLEVHYHQPTLLEPWSLNDEVILEHLGHLGIRKVSERPFQKSSGDPSEEKIAVWSSGD